MKITSKLLILAIFIQGLMMLTIWLFDAIKGYESVSINPDPFRPVITEKIKGKDFKTARNAFDSIYTMIEIQGKLFLKDGRRLTPDSELDSLKLLAYNTAVKVLIDDADKLFPSSKWNSFPLDDYKSNATYYLNLYSQGNFFEPNLKKIIDNINDYQAALRVCRGAGSITTVAGIQQLENKVKAYKHYPLTNDAELSSQLNSAVQKAKNSVSTYIDGRASNLKNEIYSFHSLDAFMERYNSINNALELFVKNYGSNSSTHSARSALAYAKNEAERYFKST